MKAQVKPSHYEFFEEKWLAYQSVPENTLSKELFIMIYRHVIEHVQTILQIFSGKEYEGIALYTLETILKEPSPSKIRILLLEPFEGLAIQDHKMLFVTASIKRLHKLYYKNSHIVEEYTFTEFSDLGKIDRDSPKYQSLIDQYLLEVHNISYNEIIENIDLLKKQGAISPSFAHEAS